MFCKTEYKYSPAVLFSDVFCARSLGLSCCVWLYGIVSFDVELISWVNILENLVLILFVRLENDSSTFWSVSFTDNNGRKRWTGTRNGCFSVLFLK